MIWHADLELAPPVAAVFCGGGARGALEVGFYSALCELGVRIDLIVGSSVGALNGAAIAAGMSASELIDLWSSIGRKNIVAPNWTAWLRPWACTGPYTLDPLRRLLREVLPVSRFERLVTPLTLVTTD
ncbi:Patatin domain protein, partial [mine drainage metagenome]